MLQRRGERVEFAFFPETAILSFLCHARARSYGRDGMVGIEGFVRVNIVLGDAVPVHDPMTQIIRKAALQI
jgi:hypothetical protein